MTFRRRRLWLVLLAGIVLAGALWLLVPNSWWESRTRFAQDESRPIGDTHVGKTRDEIVAEFGEPKSEWKGLYGLPPATYAAQHAGGKTLYFEWPSGRFYASIEEVEGRWVCFDSHWVPKGWVID
jgi:hypothetical protein